MNTTESDRLSAAAAAAAASGGFDNNFMCDTEKYHCPICLLVLQNAMQTSCGHRFCKTCIDRVIGKSTMLKCPVDKQFSKLNQIFPDIAIRREVLSLPVRCSHDECPWEGDLRGFESHIGNCEMEDVPCPFRCDVITKRCDVDDHKKTCPLRDIDCEYCREKVQYHKFESHLSLCLKVPVPCPLCLQEGFLRENLDEHKDPVRGSCPEAIVKCPYNMLGKYPYCNTGCKFTSRRVGMNDHMFSPESMASHLDIVSETIKYHEDIQKDLTNLVAKLAARVETLEGQMRGWDKRAETWKKQLHNRNVTGQLHWKVDLRGRGEYYSSPFYTGCPGYKVQVDLDTDTAREGNIRFGLTLLRGDYDDLIMWPFNATCYITILDQKIGSKPKNYTVNMVIREVPRNRPGTRTDRLFKRYIAKPIKKEEIFSQGSRFIKNGSMYLEVSVVHCVYPVPEAASTPAINLTPVSLHAVQQSPITHTTPASPVFSLSSAVSLLQ